MDCKEVKVDMRKITEEDMKKTVEMEQLMFTFNHTMPGTDEYNKLMKELFKDHIGEDSIVSAPITGAALDHLKIGNNVFINKNCLAMARGGITLEDNVLLAENVQLISNNHDPYDRQVLTCKPVLIKEGAWIGAGATILPGVCIGKYAIVGACSVVTKDVPDYAVVVGNPARIVRQLDEEKFQQ